ncbi:MAG: GTP 3',8-cyclase MoaA [Candidatus Aenigmarchaeota archaeon]|nr:GTP 3',8-cyclase MoaA [Candidatus Aenigmarchaeota archaeon]
MIKDRFGREIDILRISVTQQCNLNCPYCHREGETNIEPVMSPAEIAKIVSACAKAGIKKVKITGGEPLIRKDICEIIAQISHIPGIEDISMTTNGTMLKDTAQNLKKAGLKRINIGCDSYTSSILEKTAHKIKSGIIAAKDAGLDTIKLNMVVLKNVNESDIQNMIEFSKKSGAILQLIELIETKHNKQFFHDHYYPLKGIEKELASKADTIETRSMHNRKKYYLDGAVVEIVRPTRHEFCANCRTLRITSDGKIKPCLMRNDNLLDIVSGIRNGIKDNELNNQILRGIEKREPYVR